MTGIARGKDMKKRMLRGNLKRRKGGRKGRLGRVDFGLGVREREYHGRGGLERMELDGGGRLKDLMRGRLG